MLMTPLEEAQQLKAEVADLMARQRAMLERCNELLQGCDQLRDMIHDKAGTRAQQPATGVLVEIIAD